MSTMPNVPRQQSSRVWLEQVRKNGFPEKPGQRRYAKLGYTRILVPEKVWQAIPNPIAIVGIGDVDLTIGWSRDKLRPHLMRIHYRYDDGRANAGLIPVYTVAEFLLKGQWVMKKLKRPLRICVELSSDQKRVLAEYVSAVKDRVYQQLRQRIDAKHRS